MHLKTILNHLVRHKSFVYGRQQLVRDGTELRIEVAVRARANSRPICSGCGRARRGYDRLPERRFEYVPLWAIPVFLLYALRRVNCPQCGVTAERVPWCDGKHAQCTTYRWFLARWARRLSWQEVATIFRTSWDSVYRAVEYAVSWGLSHRKLDGIEAIGLDEVQWQRGHKYLTLVYQIDAGLRRLLWVGRDREEESVRGFFRELPAAVCGSLRYVCSDMWKPYLTVLAECAGQAVHVLDRFHIMQRMHKAIDEVRAEEARRLKAEGKEILKHARWCLLKRPENLTERQAVKLSELLKCNLKAVRSYLMKEDFQQFWEYTSPAWAAKFLRDWCRRTMRSRIEPMRQVARTLRSHSELILNWFRAKKAISAGVVEALNNKVKLCTRKAYGFRTFDAIKVALYHQLGELPEPEFAHEFCSAGSF
jgi:transposase